MEKPRYIVHSVVRRWPEDQARDAAPIDALFEGMIQAAVEDGYVLHSWRMVQLGEVGVGGHPVIEKIVAVFLESGWER